MMSSREKWNDRYRSVNAAFPEAAGVLLAYQHLLPVSAKALDLACGRAGNAFLLASNGLETTAWDISDEVIKQVQTLANREGLTILTETRDISERPPTPDSFDVIVVSRFLDRKLIPALKQAIRTGGLIYYQTFIKDKSGNVGPDNPDYLLEQNELLRFFQDWIVRAYHEEGSIGNIEVGLRNQAALVAQKPA